MNDPTHEISDDDLENDKPEEVYITMDPSQYIPPPEDYKPKKNNSWKESNIVGGKLDFQICVVIPCLGQLL